MRAKAIVSKKALTEFARVHTWQYQMDNSKGLDGWNNYSGGMEYPDWVVVPHIGRNRDSEIMSESNFEAALTMLGGESKHVQVCRFGHWGCGWFELLLVNPKSSKHLKIAYEISKSLEGYPILDDDDYYERENEYHSDYANQAKADLAEALSKHFGLKNNKPLVELAYDLNMVCQSYYGNDSCVDVYTCRAPDSRDIERLKKCMSELAWNYKTSKTYKTLADKLGMSSREVA